MKSVFALALSLAFTSSSFAHTVKGLTEKSQSAANIVASFEANADKAIPRSLLKKANCVATVPGVIRGGFIFGASFGQGLVSCRVTGGWSDPVYFSVTGGSWGWQVGVDSTDLVMVFVGPNALNRLTQANFTLGGELSVAAGPLGRDAQLDTDYQLKSEIYSYSQSRGLFVGLTLNGTVYTLNKDANEMVYGSQTTTKQILDSAEVASAITSPYVESLKKYAP